MNCPSCNKNANEYKGYPSNVICYCKCFEDKNYRIWICDDGKIFSETYNIAINKNNIQTKFSFCCVVGKKNLCYIAGYTDKGAVICEEIELDLGDDKQSIDSMDKFAKDYVKLMSF